MTLFDRVARRKSPCIENGATRPSGSDAQTSRPHRRHAPPPRPWQGGKRRPPVIEAACAALARAIRPRMADPRDRGPLYHRLADAVIVAGYSGDRILHRVRAWRSDGAESLVAVLTALIRSSDIRSGFVGRPRPLAPWQRFTVRDLAQFALGAQDRAAIATTGRALRLLAHLGLVRCTEIAVPIGGGEFRAEPGIRRLNWNRLAEMFGLGWLLARDRAALDRRHGAERSANLPQPRGKTDKAPRASGGLGAAFGSVTLHELTAATAAPAESMGAGERRRVPVHVLEAVAGLGLLKRPS